MFIIIQSKDFFILYIFDLYCDFFSSLNDQDSKIVLNEKKKELFLSMCERRIFCVLFNLFTFILNVPSVHTEIYCRCRILFVCFTSAMLLYVFLVHIECTNKNFRGYSIQSRSPSFFDFSLSFYNYLLSLSSKVTICKTLLWESLNNNVPV